MYSIQACLIGAGWQRDRGIGEPNKRVQADAAPRPETVRETGYVTRLELKPISVKPRRG
jgi:hypothetical protein